MIHNKSEEEETTILNLIKNIEFTTWQNKRIDDGDSIEYIVSHLLTLMVNNGDGKCGTDGNGNGSGNEMICSFYNPLGMKPSISITDFTYRLVKYLGCSKSCFIIALIYMDRMIMEKQVPINSFNVHRIYFSCILVSIKYYDDYFYRLDIYSRVCGTSLQDVLKMEKQAIQLLDFNVNISLDQYNNYVNCLDVKGFIQIEIDNQPSDEEEEDDDDEVQEVGEDDGNGDDGSQDDQDIHGQYQFQHAEKVPQFETSSPNISISVSTSSSIKTTYNTEVIGGDGDGGYDSPDTLAITSAALQFKKQVRDYSKINKSDTLIINLHKTNNNNNNSNSSSINNSGDNIANITTTTNITNTTTTPCNNSNNNNSKNRSKAIIIEGKFRKSYQQHNLSQSLDSKDFFLKKFSSSQKFSISPDLRSKMNCKNSSNNSSGSGSSLTNSNNNTNSNSKNRKSTIM